MKIVDKVFDKFVRFPLTVMFLLAVSQASANEEKIDYVQDVGSVWRVTGRNSVDSDTKRSFRLCTASSVDNGIKVFINQYSFDPIPSMIVISERWNIVDKPGLKKTGFIRFVRDGKQYGLFPVTIENKDRQTAFIKDVAHKRDGGAGAFRNAFEESDTMEIYMPGSIDGVRISLEDSKDVGAAMQECSSSKGQRT